MQNITRSILLILYRQWMTSIGPLAVTDTNIDTAQWSLFSVICWWGGSFWLSVPPKRWSAHAYMKQLCIFISFICQKMITFAGTCLQTAVCNNWLYSWMQMQLQSQECESFSIHINYDSLPMPEINSAPVRYKWKVWLMSNSICPRTPQSPLISLYFISSSHINILCGMYGVLPPPGWEESPSEQGCACVCAGAAAEPLSRPEVWGGRRHILRSSRPQRLTVHFGLGTSTRPSRRKHHGNDHLHTLHRWIPAVRGARQVSSCLVLLFGVSCMQLGHIGGRHPLKTRRTLELQHLN